MHKVHELYDEDSSISWHQEERKGAKKPSASEDTFGVGFKN